MCPRCGWINAPASGELLNISLTAAGDEIPALLPTFFQELTERTTADRKDVAQWVRQLRDRLVAHIGTAVAEEQASAVTWMLTTLEVLGDDDEQAAQGGPKELGIDSPAFWALQQVYLHFLAKGAVPIDTPQVHELSIFWQRDILLLSMWWHILSDALREAELGRDLRLDGDRLVVTTEDHTATTWADEVNANQLQWQPSWDRIQEAFFDPFVRDAERRVFGFSVADALPLIMATAESGRYTRFTPGRHYYLLDFGLPAPSQLREVFRRFTLTRRRLSQQIAPDFLYLPDAPIIRDTTTALEQSAAFDWLRFAPLMLGTYQEGSEKRPVAVVSKHLIERAILKTYTGVARRLAVAEQASKQRDPQTAREVAELRRRFHRRLETRVADALREIGMTALQGLEKVGGTKLACGEIDVLAAGPARSGELIVMICEVKDTDLSFFKDHGPEEALKVAQHAHEQARRKAAWVAENWTHVRDLFGVSGGDSSAATRFVGLTVPRITSLPLGAGPASIPFVELIPTAKSLLAAPLHTWRPDLQRAVVVPAAAGASTKS